MIGVIRVPIVQKRIAWLVAPRGASGSAVFGTRYADRFDRRNEKGIGDMVDKEYIERGALIAEYDRVHVGAPGGARKLMVDAPAADVVEVRRGEWKLIETEGFCDGGYYSRFCCPLCFREIGVCHDYEKDAYNYAKTMYPYCHCGAKMDGERKEQT